MNALFKFTRRALKSLRRWPEFLRCMGLTSEWLRWSRCFALQQESGFPAQFTTRSGIRLQLNDWSELTTVWRVFLSNEYLVPEDAIHIIDAGANIGAFSLFQAARSPKISIVAVEPFPETFQRLKNAIEQNNRCQQIHPMHAAVTSQKGITKFDGRSDAHSYCRRIVAETDKDAIEVPTVSLADILDNMDWREVDYLKMDIEGGEYDALLNIDPKSLRRCKAIGLEYHDSKKYPMLEAGLRGAGFRTLRHRPAGWSGLAEFRRVGE